MTRPAATAAETEFHEQMHAAHMYGLGAGEPDDEAPRAEGALNQRQHPTVMRTKFQALAQGARLASERLWSRSTGRG